MSEDIERYESQEVEVYMPGSNKPISLLLCSKCYVAEKCPEYDDEATSCPLIAKSTDVIDMNSATGIVDFIKFLLGIQAQRIVKAYAFEDIEGGIVDPNVTDQIEKFVSLVERLKKILADEDVLVIKAKGQSASIVADMFKGIKE